MKSTIKIMLVEDDKNLSLILKAFLTTKGYHTILCLNGNEALEHFNKERYDFMIVDIMIPGLDGFSLVKEVRKTNSFFSCPIHHGRTESSRLRNKSDISFFRESISETSI